MAHLRLLGVPEMERVLTTARCIAVLGIKPDSRRTADAHQIPRYLHDVGYRILPVPIRYPEVDHILGVRVHRRVSELAAPPDVLSVFARPADFTPHLPDVLAVRPSVVWFQSGLLEEGAARVLFDAGIDVAEDCIGCRRASIAPSFAPLEGQR